MIYSQAVAASGQVLSNERIVETLQAALGDKFHNQRVLVLIPDHTRSLPLPFLFRVLVEILRDTRQLDFMIALGTHPPLTEERINKLVGVNSEERKTTFRRIGLLNHAWNDPAALTTIGKMEQDEIKQIAGASWHESLPDKVDIRINKAALEYDLILILGPTFPHEVVGFSGGAKYLFPGISGADMINATHWLGALAGVVNTIGVKDTLVRQMIHAAAKRLSTPVTLIALVVEDHQLSGMFIGDYLSAWSKAADLSAERHICWCENLICVYSPARRPCMMNCGLVQKQCINSNRLWRQPVKLLSMPRILRLSARCMTGICTKLGITHCLIF